MSNCFKCNALRCYYKRTDGCTQNGIKIDEAGMCEDYIRFKCYHCKYLTEQDNEHGELEYFCDFIREKCGARSYCPEYIGSNQYRFSVRRQGGIPNDLPPQG